MEPLQSYLKFRGLSGDSPPEILESAKKEHRRLYQKEYQTNRQNKMRRLGVSLTQTEYRRVLRRGREHGVKPSTFAKEAILAYMDQTFILPSDSEVQRLEIGLRKIGTNLNQLSRRCNEKKVADLLDVVQANALLAQLEDLISDVLRNPRQEK